MIEFENIKKTALITHADLDHCGLLYMFDEVIATKKTADCLARQARGENGFREENLLHKSYINICKILTSYRLPEPEKIKVLWEEKELTEPITQIGFFDFADLHFEVYEGMGGHVPGEAVLIDYNHKIAFTGDIYINLQGLTPEQAEYNKYAPILMTSVDTNSKLCAAERNSIMNRLGVGDWQIFGGHGFKKDYNLSF